MFRAIPCREAGFPDFGVLYLRSFALLCHLAATAEQDIGFLLLSLRHAVIESREDRGELLDPIGLGIGDLAIGFEIADSGPRFGICCSGLDERLNGFLIVAHRLGDLGPLLFLCLCDLPLGMHIFDACFDAVLARGFSREYRAWSESDSCDEHRRRKGACSRISELMAISFHDASPCGFSLWHPNQLSDGFISPFIISLPPKLVCSAAHIRPNNQPVVAPDSTRQPDAFLIVYS